MSWIHEADLNRLFERALTDPSMHGAYIASSPNPLSQVEFMRELRRAVGMPIGLPATKWMVRFGARWLLRTDPELALFGRYVVSKRLKEERFEFQFPRLRDALNVLLIKPADQGQELQFGGETGTMESGSHPAQNYLGTRSHAKSNVD